MDKREASLPGAFQASMARFRGWLGVKADLKPAGTRRPCHECDLHVKCLISAHKMRKKLHLGISRARYLFVFLQKVRPLDCYRLSANQ